MIKPIEITPLNTSKKLEYACDGCGHRGVVVLDNSIVNVDQDGNPENPIDDYECPECGELL